MAFLRWKRGGSWVLALVGTGLLAYLGSRVSWQGLGTSLGDASWRWLSAAMLISMVSVSLRALRLSLLLGELTTFLQTWRAVCLGYFTSLFLPLGGGEIVKIAALSRLSSISLPRASTALAIDRGFDLAALSALLIGVVGAGLLQGVRAWPIVGLALLSAVLIALLLFILVSGEALRQRLAAWARRRPGRQPWIRRFDEIHDQAGALRRPGLLPAIGLLQGAIFTVDILSAWCILLAFPFGQGLPISAPLRLAFFVMLGFGLPLLPGGFGSHQAATILAMAPFGIGLTKALALSLAGEAAHVVTLGVLGLAAILGSGLNPLRLTTSPEVLDSPHPPEAP